MNTEALLTAMKQNPLPMEIMLQFESNGFDKLRWLSCIVNGEDYGVSIRDDEYAPMRAILAGQMQDLKIFVVHVTGLPGPNECVFRRILEGVTKVQIVPA